MWYDACCRSPLYSTSCTDKAIKSIISIGMRHLSASLSTLWNRCTVYHAEYIAHCIVSIGIIHDGVATTIHRKVLQSTTLWVVGVECLSTVAILQRSKMCIFFDFSYWFYRRFISLSWCVQQLADSFVGRWFLETAFHSLKVSLYMVVLQLFNHIWHNRLHHHA